MSDSDAARTLDQLWDKLRLDSLPGDAGARDDLRSTRTVDWSAETLRIVRETPTERVDLPRISLTPPSMGEVTHAASHDLVVVGVLGEGGMGKVLLSRQQSLDRDVAVKVARDDAKAGNINALVHEARTTGGLEHPGIIPVYALASDVNGNPALVMKRVDGVAWGRLLHDEHDPAWDRIKHRGADELAVHIDILVHVCNAIAYAHSRGVLHRDIKPSNVLIGEFGEVYVADWGVAINKAARGQHKKPALVGTPVYLAPEMVPGEDTRMDERTDVFLLGATLFEVLAGKPPFGGADLRSVLLAAWEGRHEPMPASAPQELVDVCLKAMAHEPSRRFQNATELRDALTGWVRHRGSVALARAAQERLDQLLGVLRSGSKDRATITPLLSECHFGFTQALRDWPENELASEGLRDCLEAAARFEVSQGNLEAARSFADQLPTVPKDLVVALERLEKSKADRAAREARMEHLAREHDPRVSRRERAQLYLTLIFSTLVVVGTTTFVPAVRTTMTEVTGRFYLTALMSLYLVPWAIAALLGRRSLFATRLNRRVLFGLLFAVVFPLLNRLFAAFSTDATQQVLEADLVINATIGACMGLTMQRSFAWATVAFLSAAVALIFFPTMGTPLYGLAAGTSLAVLLSSRWRNELALERRR